MKKHKRLSVDAIEEQLTTEVIGRQVLVYQSTSSTNDVAWEYARNPANNGLAVFAEQQFSGRGRRGNKWISISYESLLGSILLCGCEVGLELVTLTAAVATAEALGDFLGGRTQIKWPNDVVVGAKKVAGILVESKRSSGAMDCVIGIGVNCHQSRAFFEKMDFHRPATSLDAERGELVDRNAVASAILNLLEEKLQQARRDTESIIAEWKELSSQLGHRLVVEHNNHRFTGNCVGIDPTGGLVLQLENGGVRMFAAAQTTIVQSE